MKYQMWLSFHLPHSPTVQLPYQCTCTITCHHALFQPQNPPLHIAAGRRATPESTYLPVGSMARLGKSRHMEPKPRISLNSSGSGLKLWETLCMIRGNEKRLESLDSEGILYICLTKGLYYQRLLILSHLRLRDFESDHSFMEESTLHQ